MDNGQSFQINYLFKHKILTKVAKSKSPATKEEITKLTKTSLDSPLQTKITNEEKVCGDVAVEKTVAGR